MEFSFYLIQLLNGIQYGFLLFLVASGLTLVFGIMDVINLAHGSFYMIGAYLTFWLTGIFGSLFLGVVFAVPLAVALGFVVEKLAIAYLYKKGHLHQVLLTYALILIFDEAQRFLWGNDSHGIDIPAVLSGSIPLTDVQVYPVYRLFVSFVCIVIGLGMFYVIQKTKLGMTIRAGASNRDMIGALGVDINMLFTLVFALGAVLAGLAGMMIAPITEASVGMGNGIIIVTFVVIVIGGIGSIKGAFAAAMIVGLIDTMGRSYLDSLFKLFMSDQNAETSAPAISAMLVYILMAAILAIRPQGLFPPKGR